MAIPTLDLQDCYVITKTYERGCAYSVTEESVFAPISNQLSVFQSTSKSIEERIEEDQQTSSLLPLSAKQDGLTEATSIDLSSVDGEDTVTGISSSEETGREGTDLLGGIFDSDCIPCEFRINFKEDLNLKAALDAVGENITDIWEQWLRNALSQILAVIDMFKNLDKYVDLCAFLKFLKEFVCIPDLQKILAVLMALMMDFAFELSSVLDLVFSLIAPILYPFLSNLVNMLEKFLLIAIRPIECIIDSIINLLGKLDYNVLFQNIEQFDVSLFGKKQGPNTAPGKEVSLPTSEVLLLDKFGVSGVPDIRVVGPETSTNPASRPVEGNINPTASQVAKEETRILEAEEELKRVQASAANVDASNPEEYAKYKAESAAAAQEYKDAVRDRNLSSIGQLSQNLRSGFNSFKGMLFELVSLLREAVQKFEAFVAEMVDEFQKLYGEYVNGSGRFIDLASKKLVLVQMIGMIKAIIDAFQEGIDCEENEEVETFTSLLPETSGFSVWVDDNGDIHIQEDEDNISSAIDDVVDAIGSDDDKEPGDDSPPKDDTLDPSQKLKSLIDFTGEPALDTDIARAVEGLTVPLKVKFKCPLQTSVANAEQVNQWIQELGNQ